MPSSALFIGRNVIHLDTVSSTSRYTADLIRSRNIPEGTLVIANQQESGRGQRGKSWISQPGMNLTFTLVLTPSFLPLSDRFMLNMVSSLAVRKTAEEQTGIPSTVKWPNDVLLHGRKTSGILIENVIGNGGIQHTLAGFGINVNQIVFPGIGHATSFSAETGNVYDLSQVLDDFCKKFEAYYLRLRAGAAIEPEYHRYLEGLGEWRKYRMEEQDIFAKITGVDQRGRLCLENRSGDRFCCDMQEIGYTWS